MSELSLLLECLPQQGFAYDSGVSPFSDEQSAGKVVRAMLAADSRSDLLPHNVDRHLASVTSKAAEMAQTAAPSSDVTEFWAGVMEDVIWTQITLAIRCAPRIVVELAQFIMAARLRWRRCYPMAIADNISTAAVEVDVFFRNLPTATLTAYISRLEGSIDIINTSQVTLSLALRLK